MNEGTGLPQTKNEGEYRSMTFRACPWEYRLAGLVLCCACKGGDSGNVSDGGEDNSCPAFQLLFEELSGEAEVDCGVVTGGLEEDRAALECILDARSRHQTYRVGWKGPAAHDFSLSRGIVVRAGTGGQEVWRLRYESGILPPELGVPQTDGHAFAVRCDTYEIDEECVAGDSPQLCDESLCYTPFVGPCGCCITCVGDEREDYCEYGERVD